MSFFHGQGSSGDSSPSGDSGISENSGRTLDKYECGTQNAALCKQLSGLTRLTQDFLADVLEQNERPSKLLDELEVRITQNFLREYKTHPL